MGRGFPGLRIKVDWARLWTRDHDGAMITKRQKEAETVVTYVPDFFGEEYLFL